MDDATRRRQAETTAGFEDPDATRRALLGEIASTVEACLGCGYERRGLAADAPCPECGAEAPPTTSIQVAGYGEHWRTWIRRPMSWLMLVVVPFMIWGIAAVALGSARAGMGTTAVLVLFTGWAGWRAYQLLRPPRPDGSRWTFTGGGIRIDDGKRASEHPWDEVKRITVQGGAIRFDIGAMVWKDYWLFTGRRHEAAQALASEVRRMQVASERVPKGMRLGGPFADIVPCRRCGAPRSSTDPTVACAACGAVPDASVLVLVGRSRPDAARRAIIASALLGAGAAALLVIVVLANVLLRTRITTMTPTGIAMAMLLPAMAASGRTAWIVWRAGGRFVDRRWSADGRGLSVATASTAQGLDRTSGLGSSREALPWSMVTAIRVGPEEAGLRAIEIDVRGADAGPMRLWVAAERAESDAAALRERWGRPGGTERRS